MVIDSHGNIYISTVDSTGVISDGGFLLE